MSEENDDAVCRTCGTSFDMDEDKEDHDCEEE